MLRPVCILVSSPCRATITRCARRERKVSMSTTTLIIIIVILLLLFGGGGFWYRGRR